MNIEKLQSNSEIEVFFYNNIIKGYIIGVLYST